MRYPASVMAWCYLTFVMACVQPLSGVVMVVTTVLLANMALMNRLAKRARESEEAMREAARVVS